MSLFVIFKFPTVPSPVRPDARRGRNTEDRCRHPPDYIAGDTARGSAGQGKCRRDRGAAPHGISMCSLGLPLVLHSGIPPGRLR
ncbi:unnamed protein product, partial [Staurois parvus]